MPDQVERLATAFARRYTIERELGRGGMATVYLAQDTKHDRRVAVKVLRPALAAVLGPERFLREIRLTAKLAHPHILSLLDSGETHDHLFYVTPYLKGKSLRDRLDQDTQLSVNDALRIVREVASALQYAHDHGIVHRDIKPENILFEAGQAVVSDFGVAKAVSAAGGTKLTETGMAVGTPTYMSPEQAGGSGHVDGRSDVYALGCVFFEMLGGRPPFVGPTPENVIRQHVVAEPPDLSGLRSNIPESIRNSVRKALAKAPADRYTTPTEFVEAFETFGDKTVTPARGHRNPRAYATSTKLVVGIGISLLVLIALAIGSRVRDTTELISPPIPRQLTFNGNVSIAEISPDGQWLSYLVSGDSLGVFVRDLTGETVIPIWNYPGFTILGSLRWSPDGFTLLVQWARRGRWETSIYPRLGGTPRPIPRYAEENTVWAPDGSQLATWRYRRDDQAILPAFPEGLPHSIRLIALATGDTSFIPIPDSISPPVGRGDWSPDGKFLALTAGGFAELWTVATDGSGWRMLVQDSVRLSAPRWSPSGDAIYYLRNIFLRPDWELRKIRVASDGTAEGPPRVIPIGALPTNTFSLTGDGRKLVFVRHQRLSDLWLATKPANTQILFNRSLLTPGTSMVSGHSVSPDGQWIAYVQQLGANPELFIMPLTGGAARRLTFSGVVLGHRPVWSPTGEAIAYQVNRDGKHKIETVRLGSGEVRTYEETDVSGPVTVEWAPGERIVYQRETEVFNKTTFVLQVLDPDTGHEIPLVATPPPGSGGMGSPMYSPDGQRIAFTWTPDQANRTSSGTWVMSLEDGSPRFVVGRNQPPMGWTADGTAVYVNRVDGIYAVPVTGGDARFVSTMPSFDRVDLPRRSRICTIMDNGTDLVFLCQVAKQSSDAFMIENFDPDVP